MSCGDCFSISGTDFIPFFFAGNASLIWITAIISVVFVLVVVVFIIKKLRCDKGNFA